MKVADAFPWTCPESIYGSDGPIDKDLVEFEVEGIKLRVENANVLAPNTLRDRYRVTCLTCDELIHRATTGATTRCEQHLEDAHGIKMER